MITVDHESATPPFEQVRGQLAYQIRSGVLEAGSRLPSIRQLAGNLRVAPGTVARAFTELERAGLIRSDRRGARVQDLDITVSTDLHTATSNFVRSAKVGQLPLEDALSMIRAMAVESIRVHQRRGHHRIRREYCPRRNASGCRHNHAEIIHTRKRVRHAESPSPWRHHPVFVCHSRGPRSVLRTRQGCRRRDCHGTIRFRLRRTQLQRTRPRRPPLELRHLPTPQPRQQYERALNRRTPASRTISGRYFPSTRDHARDQFSTRSTLMGGTGSPRHVRPAVEPYAQEFR